MYEKNVLALFAHPDDAEFLCAGTLARLHGVGWRVHVASMTAGDLGSVDLGRAEISKVRRHEAQASVAELKGTYRCLECDDIFIMHDHETIVKVVSLIRAVKPAIVFTHAPSDYLVDHETTSKLAWTGAFSAGIPNLETPGIPCFETCLGFWRCAGRWGDWPRQPRLIPGTPRRSRTRCQNGTAGARLGESRRSSL